MTEPAHAKPTSSPTVTQARRGGSALPGAPGRGSIIAPPLSIPGKPVHMRHAKAIAALLCSALAVAVLSAHTQAQEQSAQSSSAYAPKVADIMGQTQLRHFKLWFAGSAGNWALASYELGQIRGGFDAAARLYHTPGGAPSARGLKDDSGPPVADVAKAVAAGNKEDFIKAFERLTMACNACHQAAHVGFIRIRVPTSSPFTDQSFPPE